MPITAFEAANPDVKVNMEIVPWAEQHQKLVTGLATGSLPDVSMLGTTWWPNSRRSMRCCR